MARGHNRYTTITPVCYNALDMKEDQRFYQERIVADPRILAGKPVVKGTRIGVDLVLEELSHNPDITELLAAHPDLTRDDVQACLAYAKDMVTGKDVGCLENFSRRRRWQRFEMHTIA